MKITSRLYEADKIARYQRAIENKLFPALSDRLQLVFRTTSLTEDKYHLKYNGSYKNKEYMGVEFLTSSTLDKTFPIFAYITYQGVKEPVGSLDLSDIYGCVDMFEGTMVDMGIIKSGKSEQTERPESTDEVKGKLQYIKYKIGDKEEAGWMGDGYVFTSAGNVIGPVGGTDSKGNKILVGIVR